MTREQVENVVHHNILLVLPELRPELIRADNSLRDLGASSIDRMDIVVGALDDLRLDVSGTALAGVDDIGSLVDALWKSSWIPRPGAEAEGAP